MFEPLSLEDRSSFLENNSDRSFEFMFGPFFCCWCCCVGQLLFFITSTHVGWTSTFLEMFRADFGVPVTKMRSTLADLSRGMLGSARLLLAFVGVDIFHISNQIQNRMPQTIIYQVSSEIITIVAKAARLTERSQISNSFDFESWSGEPSSFNQLGHQKSNTWLLLRSCGNCIRAQFSLFFFKPRQRWRLSQRVQCTSMTWLLYQNLWFTALSIIRGM